jgi:hypothetical protein
MTRADWDLKRKMELRLRLSLSAGRDGQPAPDPAELLTGSDAPLHSGRKNSLASLLRSTLARFLKRRRSA